MLTKGINFQNFKIKKNIQKIKQDLKNLINENSTVINSLSSSYKYSYNKKFIKKYNSSNKVRIFGMGGSTLGTQAIYDFLKEKIKKKFVFIDNLYPSRKKKK